jgi:NAD(P)-dependent dehydrogenase (short-subunit alcohol dehydrogenase family)
MTEMRIALVTGANKGIGLGIARELARQNLFVLLGCRNVAQGTAEAERICKDGGEARVLVLDVTDSTSIAAAVADVARDFGRLDILVNNAGVARETANPSEYKLDDIRYVFDTNFFGLIAVTQAFLPLIRKSKAGCIVNVTSDMGSMTRNTDPAHPYSGMTILAYTASKVAANVASLLFARELKDSGIKVNAVNPGYTATDMNQFRGTQTVEDSIVAPVRYALIGPDGPTGGFFDKDGPLPW